jgi:hypothetical protein
MICIATPRSGIQVDAMTIGARMCRINGGARMTLLRKYDIAESCCLTVVVEDTDDCRHYHATVPGI